MRPKALIPILMVLWCLNLEAVKKDGAERQTVEHQIGNWAVKAETLAIAQSGLHDLTGLPMW
jgi:hypothetical protein